MSPAPLRIDFKARLIPAEEGGFTAFCPQVPGAVTEGETEEEALENLVDAIGGILAVNEEMAVARYDTETPHTIKQFDLAMA